MSLHQMIVVLFFALALSEINLSTCQVVRGKVSCLDCSGHYDFSGIKILLKCDHVQKLSTSETGEEGAFEVQFPTDTTSNNTPPPPAPLSCIAKLVGGPNKLYARKTNMVSNIVKDKGDSTSYTISNPLAFFTKCPSGLEKFCSNTDSKTIDLPLPKEWGFAPSSLYFPFFPIIGVP